MVIFLRFLPIIVAILEVVTFYGQLRNPFEYPFIILAGVLALPVASLLISWRRVRFIDLMEKMLPSYILLASLAFSLLLVESRVALWVIIVLAAFSSLVSLEFLFLLAFDPARYPVNGLSRVNIAYVPMAIFYTASTSIGLMTFLHTERLWHVGILMLLGAVLFRTTGHPGASVNQNVVWSMIGAIVGAHVGLLGIFLPVSLPMQGIIASLLLSAALRVRRYKYDPKPSGRQALVEGGVALGLFIALLSTATWI